MPSKVRSVQMTVECEAGEQYEFDTAFFLFKFDVPERTTEQSSFSWEARTVENLQEDWLVRRTEPTGHYDVELILKNVTLGDPNSPFAMIWDAILEHQKEYPDHRAGCLCMNRHITTIRDWLKMTDAASNIEAHKQFLRVVRQAVDAW